MADYTVLDELATYLIAQSIGHAPSAAVSTSVPSIWKQPRDGAPEPRTGEDITITLRDTITGAPMGGAEAYLDVAYVDVIVRARTEPAGKLVHRAIRDLLHPIGEHRGKQLWTMGSLLVERSAVWRPEQALPAAPGANLATYDRVASYAFTCRRKALAGLPYAP